MRVGRAIRLYWQARPGRSDGARPASPHRNQPGPHQPGAHHRPHDRAIGKKWDFGKSSLSGYSCQFGQQGFFYQSSDFTAALAPLIADFAAFNPHATFHYGERTFPASTPGSQKWRTDQATSAHWYRPADLRNLIAAYLSDGRDRPVRDFLVEFAGLSGTQVRQKVLVAVGLAGARLSDLIVADDIDGAKVESLLAAMRANSKPVKPERLGVIGRDHLIKAVQAAGAVNADYSHEKLVTDEGLPLVVKTAFGVKQNSKAWLTMMIGLN